jgi:uncharacterized protein (TIGR00369 family)
MLSSEELQDVINTSAFDNWLGLEVQNLDAQSLVLRMALRPETVGTPKVDRLHGGAVASLLDATACYLLIAHLNTRVSTVNMFIEYLRPAHGDVVATARVVKMGKRICSVTVDAIDARAVLVATGKITVMPSAVPIGQEHLGLS